LPPSSGFKSNLRQKHVKTSDQKCNGDTFFRNVGIPRNNTELQLGRPTLSSRRSENLGNGRNLFRLPRQGQCMSVRANIACYLCSVRNVLESLHRVRPAASVWPRPTDPDEHRCGVLHPEPGATQLCCEPPHLLHLLYVYRPDTKASIGRTADFDRWFSVAQWSDASRRA
jgi:hypothetical protein